MFGGGEVRLRTLKESQMKDLHVFLLLQDHPAPMPADFCRKKSPCLTPP